MSTAEHFASTLDRDGFVVVPSFLDVNLVDQARRDLETVYEVDLDERKTRNADEALFAHGSTTTVLTPPSHLALRLPGKSAALDQCYEKILTDPMTSELLRRTVGNFKMRDVNCRYMTGSRDEGNFLNGPHELHRDSPGEFTIAVFLNEVEAGDNAGTEVVPGSHKYPWCPRWNAMFGAPFYLNRKGVRGPEDAPRYGIFNRLLHRFYVRGKNAHGVFGKPGDFYIFLNDTWHGRVPNLNGKRGMIVMAGGFPTDYPFPDEPQAFDDAMLQKIPPTYRRIAARDLPPNTDKNSVIHRLPVERRREHPANLFWWARKERQFMVWCVGAHERWTKEIRPACGQAIKGASASIAAAAQGARGAVSTVSNAAKTVARVPRAIYRRLIAMPLVGPALQSTWRRVRGVRT